MGEGSVWRHFLNTYQYAAKDATSCKHLPWMLAYFGVKIEKIYIFLVDIAIHLSVTFTEKKACYQSVEHNLGDHQHSPDSCLRLHQWSPLQQVF